jgi:hypothetical protein
MMFNKLFNSEGVEVPERPTLINDETKETLIKKAVESLYSGKYNPFDDDDREALESSLMKHYSSNCDEYELAKDFERDGWNACKQFVEELEVAVAAIEKELKEAVKEWFETHQPVPPYPMGTRLECVSWSGVEQGEIDGIYEYEPATYRVKMDNKDPEDNSRRLIKFEHATKID